MENADQLLTFTQVAIAVAGFAGAIGGVGIRVEYPGEGGGCRYPGAAPPGASSGHDHGAGGGAYRPAVAAHQACLVEQHALGSQPVDVRGVDGVGQSGGGKLGGL